MCKVAAQYKGKIHLAHAQRKGTNCLKAFDELLRIRGKQKIPAEVYHIKAAGQKKLAEAGSSFLGELKRRAAKDEGSARICTPTPAAGTGLDACFPPWTGRRRLRSVVQTPARSGHARKNQSRGQDRQRQWENLYLGAGSPDNILLAAFKSDKLKPLTGKTLAQVAKMRRQKDPIDTPAMIWSRRRITDRHIYFIHVGENVKRN